MITELSFFNENKSQSNWNSHKAATSKPQMVGNTFRGKINDLIKSQF